jgi:hypothetical protein
LGGLRIEVLAKTLVPAEVDDGLPEALGPLVEAVTS